MSDDDVTINVGPDLLGALQDSFDRARDARNRRAAPQSTTIAEAETVTWQVRRYQTQYDVEYVVLRNGQAVACGYDMATAVFLRDSLQLRDRMLAGDMELVEFAEHVRKIVRRRG